MTTGPDLAIRPLLAADAPGCDEVVRSLPFKAARESAWMAVHADHRDPGGVGRP